MVKLTKIVIPVFIFVALVMGVMSLKTGDTQKPAETFAAPISPESVVTDKELDIVSPDGKMTLKVNQKKVNSENMWKLFVGDNRIFEAIYPDGVLITVPFNTFSPDNKYIFVKLESSSPDLYYVLNTDGKSILTDGSGLEISELFYTKFSEYLITDITGWAAPTLLLVNTDKVDGSIGPSFWFDVSSKSFIQLSTRFN